MTEFSSDRLLTEVPRRNRKARIRPLGMIFVPLAAILFQVYVPRFFQYLGYLELPLLVTVYYALMRRQPIPGLLFGALVGLGQDSLSRDPVGMFGIVKTLVGYFAASVSMRFDVDNPLIQFLLGLFFFFFHQFFYWVLSRALLGQLSDFNPQQTFLFGLLNAAVALPLFMLLDRMKE
jgi:rod shape-determining protein MreD